MSGPVIDPSQHYQAAIGAMSRGAWHEAERHVRSALTANPNYFQAAVLLGEILERITVPGQAAEAYDRAAKIIPGHALPFTRKAILLFRAVFGPPPHSLPSTFPAVSMTSLGANGKFGNQLLQYAFVRLYACAHGVSPQLPDWIGRDLFDLNDPFPRTALAPIDEKQFHLAEALCGQDVACVNRDVFGYFCGPTIAWAEKKNELRTLFKPGKHVAPLIARAVTALNRRGKTLVAVHIRRGDFGYGKFWTAPTRWYLDWLKSLWDTLDRPVLYVASDEPQIVSEFSRFAPIGAADLDVCIPGAEFYLDHAILSQARHLAISNSTFSFTAAMLNERASLLLRPDPDRRCLVPFDPWNATVLLEPRLLQKPSQEDCELISHIVRPNGIAIHVGEFCAPWTVFARASKPSLKIVEIDPDSAIDQTLANKGIAHVNDLVIQRPEEVALVLKGAQSSLAAGRVDTVHFRVKDDRATAQIRQYLADDFLIFQIERNMTLIPVSADGMLQSGHHLALHKRLQSLFLNQEAKSLDIHALCARHRIQVRGVFHIGAHEGQEIATYDSLKASQVLFVEANPIVFARLCTAMAGRSDVICINRAICDREGPVKLHLASFDQSSSLFPLHRHREIYPQIVPAGSIEVAACTLDGLITELGLSPEEFNFMHIDVQGAEALVLKGATRVLETIDAVSVEVNFVDLYENCAQIEDVDDLLQQAGFRRVAMLSAFHPSWADAFYVRSVAASELQTRGAT